jgi:membrane protease YdiL (CAAX protease family)
MRCNDTLDLTLLVAEESEKVQDTKTALAYIAKFEGRDAPARILERKADLLLRLSQYDRAAAIFSRMLKGNDSSSAYFNIGRALNGLGRYADARDAFAKAAKTPYYAEASARSLFKINLRAAGADSAMQSYNSLRDFGFHADPLGKYRLELFLYHPLAAWQWRDLAGIGALFLSLCLIAVFPALLVAPIHYVGLLRKRPPPLTTRWNLKHLWVAILLLLGSTFVVTLFFDYAAIIVLFGGGMINTTGEAQSPNAWAQVIWDLILALGLLSMVRSTDLRAMWGERWSKVRSILSGLGMIVPVHIVAGGIIFILVSLFGAGIISQGYEPFKPLASDLAHVMRAIKEVFGWPVLMLLIAVASPLSEEVFFRAIALRSCQRYLPFFWANLLQATGFAAIHSGLPSIIHAFIFGIAAGYLRNKSNSLVPSISMHIANNFVAVCAFLAMG